MKARGKDRNRRYETANGFAMDVQRYLADEPVQACPPSAGYRLRKLLRRNRAVLALATLSVAAVLAVGAAAAGLVYSDWLRGINSRLEAAKNQAEAAQAEAEQARDQEQVQRERAE